MGGTSTNTRKYRFCAGFGPDVPGRRGFHEGEAALRRNKKLAQSSPAPATETAWHDRVDAFLAAEDLKGRSPRSLALHRESFSAARRHLDAVRAPADPLATDRTHLGAMVPYVPQYTVRSRGLRALSIPWSSGTTRDREGKETHTPVSRRRGA